MISEAPPQPFRFRNDLFVLGVIGYLTIVTFALALTFLPEVRSRVLQGLGNTWMGAQQAWSRRMGSGRSRWQTQALSCQAAVGEARGLLKRHAWALGAAVAVLVLVPGGMLLLRQAHSFDGYDHTASAEVNPRVTALLAGEQLAPPAALPPELFMTTEVEQAYPMALGASRQWELLDAEFRQRVLLAFRIMREQHGYEMALIEGYRSPERQAQLAAAGPQVTLAGANQSYHQYGLAADCGFLRGGKLVISERAPWAARGYELYGEVSRSLGLVWGGDWRQLRDLGHVELRRPGVLRKS